MDERTDGISRRQLSMLLFVSALSPLIRQAPGMAVQSAGSAVWLSALLALVPLPLAGLLLGRLTRKRVPGEGLGGVLLRVFAQITEHGINSVYDAVMRTCLVHCAADLQPSMQRDLRQLDTQIEALGLRIKVLQHAFNESRETMSRFREEAVLLRDLSQDENKILLENIRLHKHSIEMMRGEVNAMRRINKSWWERLRDVIMGPKS